LVLPWAQQVNPVEALPPDVAVYTKRTNAAGAVMTTMVELAPFTASPVPDVTTRELAVMSTLATVSLVLSPPTPVSLLRATCGSFDSSIVRVPTGVLVAAMLKCRCRVLHWRVSNQRHLNVALSAWFLTTGTSMLRMAASALQLLGQ
jgi:hypothetical protein